VRKPDSYAVACSLPSSPRRTPGRDGWAGCDHAFRWPTRGRDTFTMTWLSGRSASLCPQATCVCAKSDMPQIRALRSDRNGYSGKPLADRQKGCWHFSYHRAVTGSMLWHSQKACRAVEEFLAPRLRSLVGQRAHENAAESLFAVR
jgi:hypothetical protein